MRAQLMMRIASAAFLALGAACTPEVTCGEGTVADGGVCQLASQPAPPDAGEGDAGEVDAGVVIACDPACSAGQFCLDGLCARGEVPSAWRCAGSRWMDGDTCDCDCGLIDPDCANDALPVSNCLSGACGGDGTCAACVPNCTGLDCGDDGCGGSCGTCTDPSALDCIAGHCGRCVPDCDGRTCGNDGCGGSCGTCDVGKLCSFGTCQRPPPEASCNGWCGLEAESGCSCGANCAQLGTCCADIAVCGCQPDCSARECGDDGCGGSCGSCASGDSCRVGLCVDDLCAPDPCNDHGSCAAQTGACTCAERFGGARCDACAAGYVSYPDCVRDICDLEGIDCGGLGTCDPLTGTCR